MSRFLHKLTQMLIRSKLFRFGHATFLLLVLGVVTLSGHQVTAQGIAPGNGPQISLSCLTVPIIAETMATRHMTNSKLDSALLKRVVHVLADGLDPSKILLTQKEHKRVVASLEPLLQSVQKRDCSPLFDLHKEQIKWQEQLEADVRNLLNSKSFKLSRKTKIQLDADKRPRPRNKKQLRDIRNKIVQLQMANLIAGGLDQKEAKQRLIHRYELATKRIKEIKSVEILGLLLNAYALSLDPHSLYFSPDDIEDFKIQMGLSLTGIGATLTSRDGFIVVTEIVPGGPADLQGDLQTGDKIVAVAQGIDGEPVDVIDQSVRDVVKKIRGDKGTWVSLSILRQSEGTKRFRVAIKRDKIDLKEQAAKIEYHTLTRKGKPLKIALLDLPSFYAAGPKDGRDSAKDVAALLTEANQQHADALVLDLSRNGGGSLQSAIDIVGHFLRVGAVVGVGDGTTRPEIMYDYDAQLLWDKPVVVLTSLLSASASEIFAGVMKDYHRAIIVGDSKTFGKGTVQQLKPLPGDLGVIKVTTSKFFLPGGLSTQQIGVTSDLIVPSPFSHFDIGEAEEEYSLPPGSVLPFLSSDAIIGTDWRRVSHSTFDNIRKRSSTRMASIDTFKEIAKRSKEKDKKDATIITIGEVLDDAHPESDSKNKKKEEKDTKTAKNPPENAPKTPNPPETQLKQDSLPVPLPNKLAKGNPTKEESKNIENGTKIEKKGEKDPDIDKKDAETPSPQAEEAMEIAADYLELTLDITPPSPAAEPQTEPKKVRQLTQKKGIANPISPTPLTN